ncbi:uncharacterized protein LOC141804183 [Halichoeres trimaculatus]|uniref:uncharacterized protein LOC141804183 n=1 Tax=Halichoeres trimaculatus TaxID=147232 RepID=UPI003D9E9505
MTSSSTLTNQSRVSSAMNARALLPFADRVYLHRQRAESAVSGRLSLNSDRSKGEPLYFRTEPGPSDTKQRAESAVSGRLSLNSDRSRGQPLYFRAEPGSSDTKQRAESAVSGRLSLNSDRSKGEPLYFRTEPGPSDTKQRAESAVSGRLSLKSDWSRGEPLYFRTGPGSSDTNVFQDGPGPGTDRQSWTSQTDQFQVLEEHKISLKTRWERVTEGSDDPGSRALLKEIYTELYITEGPSEGVNTQHEVSQLETASKKILQDTPIKVQDTPIKVQDTPIKVQDTPIKVQDAPIKVQDIFKALPGQQESIREDLTDSIAELNQWEKFKKNLKYFFSRSQRSKNSRKIKKQGPIREDQENLTAGLNKQEPIRVVLTNGVAGVGKTFSVLKFTLDWAEGSENQDLGLVVLLSFRELNLIRRKRYSLLSLLHVFHPALEKLRAETLATVSGF